jgi:hypothetical protein
MGWGYQRRTQKGTGRTGQTGTTAPKAGTAKNPRRVKACNIAPERRDMGEFFFISFRLSFKDNRTK